MGAGAVLELDELLKERFAVMDAGRNPEQTFLQKDAEVGDEVAAGNEFLATGFAAGSARGSDGHRDDRNPARVGEGRRPADPGFANEFDHRPSNARGIDDQSPERNRSGIGVEPGQWSGELFEQAPDAGDDPDVGRAERETLGVAEAEVGFALEFPSGVVERAGGFDGSMQDRDGGGSCLWPRSSPRYTCGGRWFSMGTYQSTPSSKLQIWAVEMLVARLSVQRRDSFRHPVGFRMVA